MLTAHKFELVCGLVAAVISVLVSPGEFFSDGCAGQGQAEVSDSYRRWAVIRPFADREGCSGRPGSKLLLKKV